MNACQTHRALLLGLLASTLLLGACATSQVPERDGTASPQTSNSGTRATTATRTHQPDTPGGSNSPQQSAVRTEATEPEAEPQPAETGEPAHEFERGLASWYGPGFHGRRTANGERFDMHSLTAAHRTLPFGTLVRVRSLVNGREIQVRVNDRGPFTRGRVIDLSRAAAEALGLLELGVKNVLLLVPTATLLARDATPVAPQRRPVWPRASVQAGGGPAALSVR